MDLRSSVRAGAWFWLPAVVAFMPFAALPRLAQAPRTFERDVLPILKAHCHQCHGAAFGSGGLKLDTLANLLKGGTSGSPVVKGKSASSLLMQRLEGKGGKPQMPMGFAPLSEAKLRVIREWIDQGAKGGGSRQSEHWAYVPPKRPSIPDTGGSVWVRNPIDAFVLERLRKEGLKPSPEAARETLLRRVSLDLTGLPPTPSEMDAFLRDKSAGAYDRVVDRLLASPHYGERQARIWLDLSRYADSDGFEKDLNRKAWVYRDWLIKAFNRNLPYDRFVIEQMAGDLLPNRSMEQWVATGFHRNSMLNLEGGVDQAEAQFEVILDRVGTTGAVFLGSTIQCARCHDHKYDPFTQKDFYRLYAFFGRPDYTPRGDASVGEEKWIEPEVRVPTPEQSRRLRQLKERVAELKRKLGASSPEIEAAKSDWEALAREPAAWVVLPMTEGRSESGAALTTQSDGSVLVSGATPNRDTYRLSLRPPSGPMTGLRLELLPDASLPNRGPGRADNGNLVLGGMQVGVDGKPVSVRLARADFEQQGFPVSNVLDKDRNSGWAISPAFGQGHEAVFEFERPVLPGASRIDVVLEQQTGYLKHVIGRFRLSATGSTTPAMRLLPGDLRAILDARSRTAAEEEKLDAAFRAMTPILDPIRSRLAAASDELKALEASIPTALVLRDRPGGPLTAMIRKRGEFMSPLEEVAAGTPEFLPPMPSGVPVNRLSLAKWIASPANPLTARVQVNRMWASLFGKGIVETEEDFGTQGSPPTHPELLDWLATEFVRRKWDMKAMLKLMVTSATYRQASDLTSGLLAKDPENKWLARGPRFRMEAEMIRDNALAASGLLSRKIGGPSVFPHQPEGVWNTPYSGERWMTSEGEDLYRRGIYTFWKRTSPYAAFLNFDATSRESCTVRRIRTNTPLQALTLLNDPAFVEAAKALGRRMATASGKSPADKAVFGFRLCTGRLPTKVERDRLVSLFESTKRRYQLSPDQAKPLGGSPEAAAWTLVANVLLNLDETITKS